MGGMVVSWLDVEPQLAGLSRAFMSSFVVVENGAVD